VGESIAFRARVSSVLIVEDDDAVREAMADAVERAGYRVATASDGAHAIAYLERIDPAPDVVVLDLMMPRVDGWEVLRHLRAVKPGVPVVVVSAMQNPELPADVSFVAKPPTRERLLSAIESRCPSQVIEVPASVEATHYVRAGFEQSERARHVLARVLARYDSDEVACDVVDVDRAPAEQLERDAIFLAPTLVIRRPLRVTLPGGPVDRQFLMGLFDMAEVRRRRR
jgi:two-component system response regulator MprA